MHRRAALSALLVPVILALAACSGGAGASSTPTATATPTPTPTDAIVFGSMTLSPGAYYDNDPECHAMDGYGDIVTGAEVDVVDGAGKVLAVGQLEDGSSETDGCKFSFTITGVPLDEKLYGVKVGNANRGVVHFTKDQMFGDGPSLTLGS